MMRSAMGNYGRTLKSAVSFVASAGLLFGVCTDPALSQLSQTEKDRISQTAQQKPSIDLQIHFDDGSATIGPRAMAALRSLGAALSADTFKGSVFLIAAHTGAKGNAAGNQDLSERRAEAAKRFLMEEFKLPADSLIAVGYGDQRLKDRAHPYSGDNERIQIINLSR